MDRFITNQQATQSHFDFQKVPTYKKKLPRAKLMPVQLLQTYFYRRSFHQLEETLRTRLVQQVHFQV